MFNLPLLGHRLKGKDVYFAGIATHYIESQDINELESKLINQGNFTDSDIQQTLNQYHAKVMTMTCWSDFTVLALFKFLLIHVLN